MKQKQELIAIRSFYKLLEDCIWPGAGLNMGEMDRRHAALNYVLCRIPEEDYQRLADSMDDFCWFIPPVWNRAGVTIFPLTWHEKKVKGSKLKSARGSKVLHLSALLERTAIDIVVAIVAHELAHILLKHKIFTSTPEQYEVQESEVFDCICKWGFSREAKKHRAYWKKLDSRETALINKLKKREAN